MYVDWGTRIIYVFRADAFMTDLGGNIYDMDTNAFRLTLKDLEDSEEGMPHPDTHSHNTTVSFSGITLAHVFTITNGYTVTFEDGQYAVNLKGSNNNISDVTNVNQVSTRAFNSAGLQVVETGVSGLTPDESVALATAASEATNAHTDASTAAIQATTAAAEATSAHADAAAALTQATTAAEQATIAAVQSTAAAVDADVAATQSTEAAEQATIAADKATDAAADAEISRKLSTNKAVISPDDLLVTIYDDDGLTILYQFDISEDKRLRVPH